VRADGSLGGYVSGRPEDKLNLLRSEKIPCSGGRVDLSTYGFSDFRGQAPLQQLDRWQQEMRRRLRLTETQTPQTIAGVDVSYRQSVGFAAYVEVDPVDREVRYSAAVQQAVVFPYISSYLAFRELPILLELLRRVQSDRRLADVLVVDGAGIAHPRQMGLATMLGIAWEIPTIGVTKKRLFGRVDLAGLQFGEVRMIEDHQAQPIGAAVLPWKRTRKPIYVSPGHRVTIEQAVELVRRLLGHHRLPDPIYWADQLSRRAARAGHTTL
jgi:deoxyribonuclease V